MTGDRCGGLFFDTYAFSRIPCHPLLHSRTLSKAQDRNGEASRKEKDLGTHGQKSKHFLTSIIVNGTDRI